MTGRALVPTDRQVTVLEPLATSPVPPAPEATPGEEGERPRRWVGFLRELDPRSVEGPRLVLVVLCLTSLFARVDEQALGVLLPQIRAEFGLDLTFLAALNSVVGVVAVLVTLPAGYLADRVSRIWLVRAGTVATGATVLAQGLAPGIGALVAARVGNGVAQGVAPPASFSLQTDYFPPKTRARVFAIFFAASQAGLILGPLVAGVAGSRSGWRPTLLALGGLGAASGLLVLLLREPRRGRYDPLPTGPADGAAAEPAALSFSQAYRSAAGIATMRRLWYATPLLNVRSVFTFLVLPAYFSEVYQFSTVQLGLLVSLSGVSGLVGLLAAGAVGDRILADRPGRYLGLMGLITAAQAGLLVLLSFSPSLTVALVATQGLVIVETSLQPAFYTLISLVVPTRLRGLGLATSAPWQVLGLLLAPFVVGTVAQVGLHRGVLVFVPLLLLGALILGTGGPGVERDLRAVRAGELAAARARSGDALLVCRDLVVGYGGVTVIPGLDLDLASGEIVALLGTNGAGKSTVLRALAGLQTADNGAVLFDGVDITRLPAHEVARLGVALMPGGAAVFPALTVAENLAVGETDAAGRAEDLLRLFPALAHRQATPAGNLSGGEQQMLGVACTLARRPRLLLIDELSLGLAPAVVEQLIAAVREVNRSGTTVVVVEQSLNVALTVASRAIFLERGQVRFDGTPAELVRRPDLVRSVLLGRAAGGTRVVPVARPEAGPSRPALAVRGLSVTFGGTRALADVSLEVGRGEVLGLIGPNGAGKTTLFDAISGFVTCAGGTIAIGGRELGGLAPHQRARLGLARSFQSARLFPALSVRETVATALDAESARSVLLGLLWAPQVRASERRLDRRIDRLLDLLGLAAYAETPIAQLSTGTRRAVDIACVLAREPTLLLLDEPSSGLAQAETEALAPLLRRVVRETGTGLVIIEHDLSLVTALADRLVAFDRGRVVAEGSPAEVCADPRVLASYLAAPTSLLQRSGPVGAALSEILVGPSGPAHPKEP